MAPVVTQTTGYDATYDAWNRLASLSDSNSDDAIQRNEYDGRNYRVVRRDYTSGTLSETRHFYYTDGWKCLEERLGTSPDATASDRHFVWGIGYIDDLVCRDRSVTSTLDERLYSCQDANWNVTAVVATSGAVEERFEYNPYGTATFLSPAFAARTTSSFAWDVTYAGYRFDQLSGTFAVRNRVYSPRIGKWLSRDPIGYAAGLSLSAYVGSRPIRDTDAVGLGWFNSAMDKYIEWMTPQWDFLYLEAMLLAQGGANVAQSGANVGISTINFVGDVFAPPVNDHGQYQSPLDKPMPFPIAFDLIPNIPQQNYRGKFAPETDFEHHVSLSLADFGFNVLAVVGSGYAASKVPQLRPITYSSRECPVATGPVHGMRSMTISGHGSWPDPWPTFQRSGTTITFDGPMGSSLDGSRAFYVVEGLGENPAAVMDGMGWSEGSWSTLPNRPIPNILVEPYDYKLAFENGIIGQPNPLWPNGTITVKEPYWLSELVGENMGNVKFAGCQTIYAPWGPAPVPAPVP